MKKLCFLVALVSMLALSATSQVAVNTDGSLPDNSAMLDVSSTTKGFLPPRIALTGTNTANPVVSPASGLLVYNTSTAGLYPNNVVPGYYYWNGAAWTTLGLTQGTGGQTLRHDGSNWIANSVLQNDGTNIGIGTTNPTHKLTITGTTQTLRLIGPGTYGSTAALNFGDGSYAYLSEDIDDNLLIHATNRIAITGGNVGIGTTSPAASAALEVSSTTNGVLLPRMTFAQRNAIMSPAEGLSVICTNCTADGTGCYSIYLGGQWLNLAGSCVVPASPTEGSHVQSNTQIIWNWSYVPIATGYKWNTTSDYATATDMGTMLTRTETGLTSGTSYTRYIWAYNACGYSAPVILNAQAFTCGSSFTVSHVAGNIAPVAKTVTYGTVTNIPGETTKCWITRNLGATQQPNTVFDNTEAAAGWYWQFNLKQGYMHDGTTRTPNTVWITTINENSDWTANNDPCSLLLGSAWRLPTLAEWTNVDATGNWTDWYGPWDSALKMHAAGYLPDNNGFMSNRGFYGIYWSSTQVQNNATYGSYLIFSTGMSYMYSFFKAGGFSVRCVRD